MKLPSFKMTFYLLVSGFLFLTVDSLAGAPKKGVINVYKTVYQKINAETIDKKLLQEIMEYEHRIDTIIEKLSSFNKIDTLEFELISLYQKQLQNYKELLVSKYDEWNEKYGQLFNDYSDDPTYNEYGQRTDKFHYVTRVLTEQVKQGASLEGGDSSFVQITVNSPTIAYKLINNINKKTIWNVPSLNQKSDYKIMSTVILDSLSNYFNMPENHSKKNDQNISLVIYDGKQQLDRFNFMYTHHYFPYDAMSSNEYHSDHEEDKMDDSTLLKMKTDSLEKLYNEQKHKTCAFFKIVVEKTHESTPEAIATAESIVQNIDSEISAFDLTSNLNLDSLKRLVIQSNLAHEQVTKAYEEWEEEHGAGYPAEYTYSSELVDNGTGWNYESDELETFEILGNGTDLIMECVEKGKKKPFLSYSIPELTGTFEFDIEELKKDIGDYLYSEHSSFRTEYATQVVFRVKKKNKIIATFEVSLSAQVG